MLMHSADEEGEGNNKKEEGDEEREGTGTCRALVGA